MTQSIGDTIRDIVAAAKRDGADHTEWVRDYLAEKSPRGQCRIEYARQMIDIHVTQYKQVEVTK